MTELDIHRGDVFSIAQEVCQKWQQSIDLMAEVFEVPAALIMRVDQHDIEVFLSSKTKDNPYTEGEKANLNTGLYCETVMATEQQLLVPDALQDPKWDHNPDIDLDMIAYLGLPLRWPDGFVFGTICALDNKANNYSPIYIRMIEQFRQIIEKDLRQIIQITELQNTIDELESTKSQLQESQKIAAQTSVIAGLAHIINTPIGISVTAASHGLDTISQLLNELGKNKTPADGLKNNLETVHDSLIMVDSNLNKSSKILSRIKLISSDNAGRNKIIIQPKELIQDIIKTFDNMLQEKDIRIDLQCPSDIHITAYPAVFFEIFTNLINNSIQHGFKGLTSGIINIDIRKNKQHLDIRYSDNGCGFDISDKEHLYEPFGLLKKAGSSMGLGMNIIYNQITQNLKGTIDCQSSIGNGIIFIIKTPII